MTVNRNISNVLALRPKARDFEDSELIPSAFRYAEQKLDGHRLTIFRNSDGIKAIGRVVRNDYWPRIEAYLPSLAHRIESLPPGTVLDGELVGRDTSSDVITNIYGKTADFYCFAIPYFGPNPCVGFEKQRSIAAEFDLSVPLRLPIDGPCTKEGLLSTIKVLRWEGVMLKLEPWANWYKLKPIKTVDAFVTGWQPHIHGAHKMGALTVSVHTKEGNEVEIADVGGGFSDVQRLSITAANSIGRVCEIVYQEVGAKGRLRFPRFLRWRDDKPSKECTIEQLSN